MVLPIGYSKIIETIFKYLPNPQAVELNKWIDELRKENDALRDEVRDLKGRIGELRAPTINNPVHAPSCPNCSTVEDRSS